MATYKKQIIIAVVIWFVVNVVGTHWISYYGRHVYREDILDTFSAAAVITYILILNKRRQHGAD
jgi:S-adenosylmethionine:diacylglycerol 3-amino-3-carboxypropyl transferase